MTPAETAAATILRHRMIEPGQTVLAAFSGGADSTAMVLLLRQLGHRVVLGHVDHRMRDGSGADAAHCRQVGEDLGLPFLETRVKVDPPTQAEARRVRYLALEQMAKDSGAGRIATGHTADDQAETVMLRLGRGGYGLGIPPKRGNVIRPLLDLRRRDTESVCREARIEFCLDPSNLNPKYRRVAVRTRLAGAPDEEIGRLTAVAEGARRNTQEIARRVEVLWPGIATTSDREIRLVRRGLEQAEVPVRHQLVRRAAGGLGLELTTQVVKDILLKVVPVTGARLALPGGLSVWSEREEVVIGRYKSPKMLPAVSLKMPGITILPGWGAALNLETCQVPSGPIGNRDRSTELVDAAALTGEVSVRQWQPGDRFHPLGAPGTRKLQDFFVDTGVPRAVRSGVPVVVCGDRIVWLAGHRLDDRFKVGPQTSTVVRMTLLADVDEEVA